MEDNSSSYIEKICKYCKNYPTCNHDIIREQKFINGIVNKKCGSYEYNEVV